MSHGHDAAAPQPVGPVQFIVNCAYVALAVFHIYISFVGAFDPLIQRGIFIGAGVGLVYFVNRRTAKEAGGWNWRLLLDSGLAILGLYGGLHVAIHTDRLMDIMNDMTPFDLTVGVVMIAVVLEAARRSIGLSLPIMAIVGLVYYFFGDTSWLGDWRSAPLSMQTGMGYLYGSTNGIFGFMADIGTRVIAIYVIYGSLLMALGGGEAFIQASAMIAGRSYGGPAKVAVMTSALFGTVSGSAVANVMSVGSITIPTMFRAGYRKDFAAGVEASASAGGQIMPPVMGAGAFIMAELLNIPYGAIAAAAAIPAILYFTAIYVSVDFFARQNKLNPTAKGDIPTARQVFLSKNTLPAFGPILILAYLLFEGYTPTLAGAVATVLLVIFAAATRIGWMIAEGRIGEFGSEARAFLKATWAGLVDGGKSLVFIAALLACASILVAVLSATGLGVKVSQLLIGLSGENLVAVLILSAVLCIMLGMDVPTTASYILTVSVAGPLLVRLGLEPLVAHLFIFYFAILSAITPPVCASVYAAATIAGENFWKVAGQALRIAGAVYFIPFMFVWRPGLLLMAPLPDIIYDSVVAFVAIVSFGAASIGYMYGNLNWPLRTAFYALGFILFIPAWWTDIAGLVGVVALGVWRWRTQGKELAPAKA